MRKQCVYKSRNETDAAKSQEILLPFNNGDSRRRIPQRPGIGDLLAVLCLDAKARFG